MKLQKILSRLVWLACFPIRHLIHRTMDEMIREAMSERRLVSCDYNGFHRIIELHVYGRKNDHNGILAYQIGGESSQNELGWRRMYLDKMTSMKVLDEEFPGKRETYGPHSLWDFIYFIID